MTPTQISALQEEVRRLREALEICANFDRSPIPEYGETVRGHIPGVGQRFLTPKEAARKALSSPSVSSNLSKVAQAKERVIEAAKKLSNCMCEFADDPAAWSEHYSVFSESICDLDAAEKEAGE